MLVKKVTLLSAVAVTGASGAFKPRDKKATFQATGLTTAGAGAATIKIQATIDGTNWLTIATITLTLSTVTSSDGFAMDAAWESVRANVTAISGTGASVTVLMGS